MADELDSKEPKGRQQIRTHSPTFTRVWANDALVGHSPWDFRLVLGQLRRADVEVLEAEEQVEVHMSPQFAMRLLDVLQKNITKYETNFGKIELPHGVPKIGEEE